MDAFGAVGAPLSVVYFPTRCGVGELALKGVDGWVVKCDDIVGFLCVSAKGNDGVRWGEMGFQSELLMVGGKVCIHRRGCFFLRENRRTPTLNGNF